MRFTRRKRQVLKNKMVRNKPRKFSGGGGAPSDSPSFKQDFAGGSDRHMPAFRVGVPATETQALMEAAPGCEPKESVDQMLDHDERVANLLNEALAHPSITEIERISVKLTLMSAMPVREQEVFLKSLPVELRGPGGVTKSTVHRARQRAMKKLASIISPEDLKELYS